MARATLGYDKKSSSNFAIPSITDRKVEHWNYLDQVWNSARSAPVSVSAKRIRGF